MLTSQCGRFVLAFLAVACGNPPAFLLVFNEIFSSATDNPEQGHHHGFCASISSLDRSFGSAVSSDCRPPCSRTCPFSPRNPDCFNCAERAGQFDGGGPRISRWLFSGQISSLDQAERVRHSRPHLVWGTDRFCRSCDTRDVVLKRDGTNVVQSSTGCTITGGTWVSPYDGATWTASSDVDIDHLVPLSNAWKVRIFSGHWLCVQRTDMYLIVGCLCMDHCRKTSFCQ